jgi:nitrite reductase/ring-hydroxylating ferredoxin subunit
MKGQQPKCKRTWGIAECKCLALDSGGVCWSAGTCPHQSCPPPHLIEESTVTCPQCGHTFKGA